VRNRVALTFLAALLPLLLLARTGRGAEVRIDVSKMPGKKITLLVPAFLDDKSADRGELRDVLVNDLRLSGYFDLPADIPADLTVNGAELAAKPDRYDALVRNGIELLVNLRASTQDGRFVLEGFVYDTATRTHVFGKRYRGPDASRTKMMHILAGEIIQELTGVRSLTGSRLAFLWKSSGKKQVFVSDYDSSNARAVSVPGELALFPEWLPDGQGLVYTSFASGFPELILEDLDNRQRKVLTSYPGMNANVSFSPDGQHFLATLSKDGNPEIYKLDLRGKVVQRMTHDAAVDTSPCYSPDGKKFAFVSDKSGSPQIYIMNASGGKPTRLTFNGAYNVSPDWSPGGRHIAFSSMVDRNFQLMMINTATGETTQLTEGPGNKEDPDWGIDDRHLVFTLTRDYKSDLYILDVHSREMTQLTKGKGDFASPSWSGEAP
jgi:TolB protein